MDTAWQEIGFYFESKTGEAGKDIEHRKMRIKKSLLLEDARKWAQDFIRANPELKATQIRRFYHDVKALEAKIEASGFEKNLPLIKMLKSKVAYACPKYGSRKVPIVFKEFMDKCIDGIEEQKDFEAFTLVFEAVVGYFYGEGGRTT